jgi:osmotically-inducible protein OsmY
MRTAIGFGLLLAGIACSRTNNDAADKASDDSRRPDIHAARPEVTEPDNTGKNERDRQPSAVTPEDQGNNESDLKITQEIRQGVMKLDDTSMDAKNVKIITSGGVVTLRGPVDSAQEKAEIARLAQSTSGVTRVDNQIEVTSSAKEPDSNTSRNSGATRSGTTSSNLKSTTSGSTNRAGALDRSTARPKTEPH